MLAARDYADYAWTYDNAPRGCQLVQLLKVVVGPHKYSCLPRSFHGNYYEGTLIFESSGKVDIVVLLCGHQMTQDSLEDVKGEKARLEDDLRR